MNEQLQFEVQLIRIDKTDGSETVVNDQREAVERIANHLECTVVDVLEQLREHKRIETSFNVYELREEIVVRVVDGR